MAAFFLLLTLSTPQSPSLIENLDKLAQQLFNQQLELSALEKKRSGIDQDLADLRSQLARTNLEFSEINLHFKTRIRSLAKMPTGARVTLLGGVSSLEDYLKTKQMLRQIAQYDKKLHDKSLKLQKRLTRLTQSLENKEQQLNEASSEIRRRREMILTKRNTKLQFLQNILNSRPQTRQLALEFIRINHKLDTTIGTLTPGPAKSSSIRSHRGSLPWPTLGSLISHFGHKVESKSGTVTTQNGISLQAPYGTPVYAIFDATVVHTGWLAGYGQIVVLDHGERYHSIVGHLRSADVIVGQEIKQSDPIGTVGDSGSLTGTKLYFELRSNGKPIDPIEWLRQP